MLAGSYEDRKAHARAMAAEMRRREALDARTPQQIAADNAAILAALRDLARSLQTR